jgi:hypothetical protein
MFMKVLLFEILGLFLLGNAQSQEWIRIYGDTVNTVIYRGYELYDLGYIFTGKIEVGYTSYGWLMKTDINGYKRWSKAYGLNGKRNSISSSRRTADNGIIAVGGTNNLSSNCTDPIIYKINTCGEKEWCKIYNAPGCDGWGSDIEITGDEGYIVLIDRWKSGEEQRIWLFRLDSLGEVIWAQAFATDPAFWSEWSHSLIKTNDNCFLITGETYYPDSTYPNKKIIKILLIKVNLDGEAIFEVPWGTSNGIYSDGRLSVTDAKNNIFTAGRRARKTSPYGDSPCLFKTSENGKPVFFNDLKTTSEAGIATTVNWFQDSTLGICAQWHYAASPDTTGVIKTDSFGNTIGAITFPENYSIYGSDVTFNDKLILGGTYYASGYFKGCAIKLTNSLEYDSIYTTPFTYDSLCPHAIVSDTIPLDDCEVVVVGIDEALQNPETTKLHIYPNPANTKVTLELPRYIIRKSGTQGLNSTTIYHQWKETRLEVYDLQGRLMYSEVIPQKQQKVEIGLTAWSPGMYVARVVFMNEVVCRAKFVVKGIHDSHWTLLESL